MDGGSFIPSYSSLAAPFFSPFFPFSFFSVLVNYHVLFKHREKLALEVGLPHTYPPPCPGLGAAFLRKGKEGKGE